MLHEQSWTWRESCRRRTLCLRTPCRRFLIFLRTWPLRFRLSGTISSRRRHMGRTVHCQALAWGLKDQHLTYIGDLLRHPGFVQILFERGGLPAQRLLGLLASYPQLYKALLERRDGEKDIVERLSAIICGDFEDASRLAALTCIGQLALAHDDARAALLDSHALMPALVQRVWSLVAGFWDGETVDAPDAAMEMRVLQQAVHVMHHLALSRGATNELRDRLHAGQGGIDYMFAVAIGRLAYADPPERLAQTLRDELRKLTEFARDLLELVVDGPEMDEIYNAYQWDDTEQDDGEGGVSVAASVTEDEDSLMADDFDD
ncbi:hypothetical protein EXIGLDRAFT_168292 [Exidia glandulosa HHB12029]|uniref:ARM repeat-containing protein n=1 Tax=Exidia glandulosa HHB12029 TaxID=1314781 RepID=A0A166BE80_EXIGL|nr:hypothetical protein EXIGLDRAFT_168292 [Exidia glandulosa HHB12029]